MSIMQVFRKPNGEAFAYKSSARNLAEAQELGPVLARRQPQVFGEFLYARSSYRQPIRLGEMYHLMPSQLHMRYRRESEAVSAPFDYIRYSGAHQQDLGFDLAWTDPASGGEVSLVVWFGAARAGKFWDMCKKHLACFILRDGQPFLQFCHEMTHAPAIEIALARRDAGGELQ